ncbi:MAG TPA: ATP-binding protein [Pseudonocardiaceae bacterium]|nr:ATP-binding protein [Pseudonocardiaceae bacterium]
MTVRTSTALPAGTMAVPAARHFTSDVLRTWPVAGETRETAELVVSELVGNAVQHGDGIAELGLILDDDVVRIEVVDNSPVLPVLLRPGPADDRHRGLLIVAGLSVNWGSRREAAGKTVWAELRRASAAAGTSETSQDSRVSGRRTATGVVPAPALRTATAERSPTG